jgi:hypothetical protein
MLNYYVFGITIRIPKDFSGKPTATPMPSLLQQFFVMPFAGRPQASRTARRYAKKPAAPSKANWHISSLGLFSEVGL